MIPIILNQLNGGQAANKCTCLSPLFMVNGYVNKDSIPEFFLSDLEVINKLVSHLMPQRSYYASRYQKDHKVSPRDVFSEKSTFTEEVLLPLLLDFSSFEGRPIYLSKVGVWAALHKFGLIYCQLSKLVSDRAKSLKDKIEKSEWADFVKATLSNIVNSMKFNPYFIFPLKLLSSDIFWSGGFSFNLASNDFVFVNINNLCHLSTINNTYNKAPDHLILTTSDDDKIKFSFTYDFASCGGAKALYSFASAIHESYPEFDYYRYNGKSDPFYYPLTCYSKLGVR